MVVLHLHLHQNKDRRERGVARYEFVESSCKAEMELFDHNIIYGIQIKAYHNTKHSFESGKRHWWELAGGGISDHSNCYSSASHIICIWIKRLRTHNIVIGWAYWENCSNMQGTRALRDSLSTHTQWRHTYRHEMRLRYVNTQIQCGNDDYNITMGIFIHLCGNLLFRSHPWSGATFFTFVKSTRRRQRHNNFPPCACNPIHTVLSVNMAQEHLFAALVCSN